MTGAYVAPRVHRRILTKPDGRTLWLYARTPIDGPGGVPTEVPSGPWDVAVFENRFPTLHRAAHNPPSVYVKTLPASGQCEVVVYTQGAEGSLGALPLWHVEMIIRVWAERTRELGARDDVQYVMPFENRGVEVGVTLPHPHGQLYAYPFVPPVAAREQRMEDEFFTREGRPLLATVLAGERDDGRRIVHVEERAMAFVPAFARYAYEVWVAPMRSVASLADLAAELRAVEVSVA